MPSNPLRNLFRTRVARDRELDREIESHLQMAIGDRLERGEPPEIAGVSARREFGNIGLVKEVTREMWGWASVERLRQDAGYAARILRKNPAYASVAILSIALGVGANTAIFSVMDAVMLKSLPVEDPGRLVAIGDPTRVSGRSQGSGRMDIFSYPFYERFRENNGVFSDVYGSGRSEQLEVAFPGRQTAGSAPDGEPRGRLVTGNFFAVLGVPALIGRTFTDQETRVPAAAPVVVISYGYWQRQFARNPAIVGQNLLINRSRFTVIGVTPPDFFGDIVGAPTDIWIPVTMEAQANPGHDYLKAPKVSWLLLMGRLKPGVSQQQAEARLKILVPQILKDQFQSIEPPEGLREMLKQKVEISSGAKGFSRLRAQFSLPLTALMGIVGLVLLICCFNVANLQLARAVSRGREMGLRIAVGAGQARLVRQLLTESLLVALAGGAAGLLLAWWGSALLVRLESQSSVAPIDIHADARVLFFTALVSLAAGLIFGLAPAWKASRLDVVSSLKSSKSGTADRFTRAFGKLLMVAQIVFSVVLIVLAGLFIRTLRNLENVDVGYQRGGLMLAEIDSTAGGYRDAQVNRLTRDLMERLERIPGVAAVSVSENGLFSGTDSGSDAVVEGFTARQVADRLNSSDRVGPNYFQVVGTPVLEGRGIGPEDTETAPKVAVINETMARFYFPSGHPVGRHIFDGEGNDRTAYTIVGVVRDVKQNDLRRATPRRFYTAYLQHRDRDPIDAINFEIRTVAAAGNIAEAVRRTISAVNPSLPILSIDSADDLIGNALTQEQVIAKLSGFFGALALTLAAIGLYGVMSYITARRSTEIGIRFALGARRSIVLGMVLKDTLLLVAAGLAIGIAASALIAKLFASGLFGLAAFDPLTSVSAAMAITVAAAMAAFWPAWRASRVDPMVALRDE
jgi:predicted permease